MYGVGPYLLMNYNDTLDAAFTLRARGRPRDAHRAVVRDASRSSPPSYTIFVAEVASTTNERFLLDQLLQQTSDPKERFLLLQHAVDSIVGTFYTQVMFADFELRAHRLVEKGQPVTTEVLNNIYAGLLQGVLGRRADGGRLLQVHLGAHPALLQHAVLRLPVRHLLRLVGAALRAR